MEIVDVQHTYEELLETFRDGDGSVVNPLVRRCQSHEAEIARLTAALAAANEECERLRGEYKALNRQLAVAKKIFDSCRNNDNHWGDVEVENHRLKADLAAKDAMLAAASQSVSDVLASADTNSHSHGHWALVTHENYEKLRAVVAGWLEPTQQPTQGARP
jgi:chromosome segregation ATPase